MFGQFHLGLTLQLNIPAESTIPMQGTRCMQLQDYLCIPRFSMVCGPSLFKKRQQKIVRRRKGLRVIIPGSGDLGGLWVRQVPTFSFSFSFFFSSWLCRNYLCETLELATRQEFKQFLVYHLHVGGGRAGAHRR